MVIDKALAVVIFPLLLAVASLQGVAGEEELCAPFLNGKVDMSKVEAMRAAARQGHLYRIEPGTSRVGFCIDSELAPVKAEFKDFQGGLTLWPDQRWKKEQAMVVVKTASLDTGGSMIEYLLKSKRFFDVEKYAEILFVSTDFKWTSETTGVLKGDLTLHGVTRSVTFHVKVMSIVKGNEKDPGRVLVKAGTTIHRSDFGMDTLSRVIKDDVELCMTVEAVRYHG
jgi:polyisoprenoid-binding protein YceI